MSDKQVPLVFPVKGLNVATSYGQQPEESTPVGVNVRAFEAQYGRGRGGSRPGLSKYIADTVPAGSHLIQHLNIIVDPQAPALLGDTDPTAPDPSTNNLRQRYPANRKYRPGGSAVKPKVVPSTSGPITLIQKKAEQAGRLSAKYTLSLDDDVTVGNVVFVIVRTQLRGTNPELVEAVRNGIQVDYDRAGGSGYFAQVTDAETPINTHALSVYWRSVQSADDKTVEVTPGTPGSLNIYEVAMFEYQGPATDGPISNQVKLSDSGPATTFTLPDLAMDGTDGQMVLAAFIKINTNVSSVGGDYIGRFGAGGATPANFGVIEKKPISGAAPENPAVAVPDARLWCGIAIAVTR